MQNKAIIICGPTASGKTNFAHQLALKHNGEVINADSMQVYQGLPILTSSPAEELREEVDYHLYNFLNLKADFSAAKYADLASAKVREVCEKGKLPVIVGGSGMYISMLLYGYSDIPDISPEIRADVRALREKIGPEEFFARLASRDPVSANTLKISDSQRVIRAYEIFEATGKTISFFQENGNVKPLQDTAVEVIFLLPERQFLYSMCNARFNEMLENGAIEEVETAIKNYPQNTSSSTKALGFKEIATYLRSEISRDEMIEQAAASTRHYAKRQITWFRNQVKEKKVIEFGSIGEYEGIVYM